MEQGKIFNKWWNMHQTGFAKILVSYMHKMNSDLCLISWTKVKSKYIKNVDVKFESIRCIEENLGRPLHDMTWQYIFKDETPQTKQVEAKNNRWDYIKIQKFCSSKKKRIQRPYTEWERLFTNTHLYIHYIQGTGSTL